MFPLQLAAAALNCKGGNPASATYAKTMDSGYPLEWFAEAVEEFLICEICGKVLQSPLATQCGHVYCQHCLEFWIEYYGICPKRCGEIEVDTLKKAPHIEKRILSLKVRCKYHKYGCRDLFSLADKHKHEKKCLCRKSELKHSPIAAKNSLSQDSYVEMASRGRVNLPSTMYSSQIFQQDKCSPEVLVQKQLIFHLTRKNEESLGFVLVAGAKNSNGRAVNFSIKAVNHNTVAAEAGLQPGDKIIQVDNISLSELSQKEAVLRIKSNPEVILTVTREQKAPRQHQSTSEHIYEDILYSDIPQLSQDIVQLDLVSDLTVPGEASDSYSREMELLKRFKKKPQDFQPARSEAIDPSRLVPPPRQKHHSEKLSKSSKSPKHLSERISADSGLSSGTSGSPTGNKHHLQPPPVVSLALDRHINGRHSYRTEREIMKRFHHDMRRRNYNDPTASSQHSRPRKTSIDGDYEVEEIFLQKNGTNQLGITLGYDAQSAAGRLFICEIIAEGLAAKDGRLQCGDIVRKVNGFEVYDPEEAVLLFLEQDQDISLTVARKMKIPRRTKGMMPSKSHASLFHSRHNVRQLELQDAGMRRTDSCGSLDSHSHRYSESWQDEEEEEFQSPRTNSDSSARRHRTHSPLVISPRIFHPPTVSSGYATGGDIPDTPTLSHTDFVFKPIREGRPATANEVVSMRRILRSSTSLGSANSYNSAPVPSTVHLQHAPPLPPPQSMTRRTSLGSRDGAMLVNGHHQPWYRPTGHDHTHIPNRCDSIGSGETYHSSTNFRTESLV